MNLTMKIKALFGVISLTIISFSPVLGGTLWAADAISFNPRPIPIVSVSTDGFPIGFIGTWPLGQDPPDMYDKKGNAKWLECNGQTINPAVYPELRALYGAAVPNYAGMFLRGQGSYDAARTAGTLGQVQLDQMQGHWHNMVNTPTQILAAGGTAQHTYRLKTDVRAEDLPRWGAGSPTSDGVHGDPRVGTENRPVNMAVRYMVRASR
jgi:hypothetical protein